VVVTLKKMQEFGQLLRVATVGLLTCSVLIPVMGVGRVAINGATAAQVVPAVIATGAVVPVQVWLALAASRSYPSTRHRWALGVLAAGILAMLPIIGTTWLGALFPLSALVLVIVPRPYSVAIFGMLVALPIPVAHWLGESKWATYFSVGTFMFGTSVAVPIWLIAAARQLQTARLRLADEAVLRERLRIDAELFPTVGAALRAIIKRGESAGNQASADPAAAAKVLRDLVHDSRQTLTDARRLIRRYQGVSLRSELATAQVLLAAAGIRARLVLPPGDLPDMLDDDQRRSLQSAIASVLRNDNVHHCVITVTRDDGAVQIEIQGQHRTSDEHLTANPAHGTWSRHE
jgi:two-component system sensor histidine kinase DesK